MFCAHGHVRIERVVLEHHGDAAVGRLVAGDVAVVDDDAARGDRLQPGDDAQQRRLAAAGRADHDDELALLDREAHALDGAEGAVVLGDVVDDEARHRVAPTCRARPGFRTKYFCEKKKTTTIGTMAMASPAITAGQSEVNSPWQLEDADRQRLQRRTRQHQQREQELVPDEHRLEDRGAGHAPGRRAAG